MARRSFFATGASGQTPVPLRTLRTSNPSSSILWSPVSTERAATWTHPAMLAVGAMRSRRPVRPDAALVGDEARHPLVGERPALQHEHRGVGGLRVADSLVELPLDPGHAAGRSRAHGEVSRRIDGPAGVLAGQARRHRMIGRDRHRREPEAAEVDARERHRGQAGETDLREPPTRLEAAWPPATPQSRTRAPPSAPSTATPRSAASAGERIGQSRRAAVQAEVRDHGASRHDAPRLRARLTRPTPDGRRTSPRSESARASAAVSPSDQREHRRPPGALPDAVGAARQRELGHLAARLGREAAALMRARSTRRRSPGSR